MTAFDLNKELEYVNHSREHRQYYARLVIDNPDLLPQVLDLAFDVNNRKSCKAALLLEFIVREDLYAILPYLNRITSNMAQIHFDAAVRPIAKICECLIEAFYSKIENPVQTALTKTQRERIIEQSFDYLIGDYAIAPKAYGMTNLFRLGYEFDWIHPELILILERNYAHGSAGYKVRAGRILNILKNDN
ncbi:MAG: adenylosuccinate lyase [Flavobacteriaceae bacterium]|nr:adenylosuccinate lyase [Bacteroidia bacterium]MBT8287481.1 adenylosuccinate lyase [Bacteroidia bacterium]NNF75940.1 adenylosuccinate lyase [Flavobacteriaceae bacterium]NNK73864.1 adenylosuccinate lyase [Flavobacteriaceae bacterium]